MDPKEIRERVAAFPRWHYEFDLQGVITPIADDPNRSSEQHRNRLRQRRAYFFDPLVALAGGSLKGKRVLDLGCNAGYWSLAAIQAGADFVHGIDGRQMHVDQANLVFEALDIDKDRYRFELGNVLLDDLGALGPFDVVLCLGLLYHVTNPIELFENISHASSDLLVIDTGVAWGSGRAFEIRRESLSDPRSAVVHELVMIPSVRAVMYLARNYNYEIVTLEQNITDYNGLPEYERDERYAFIAAKKTPLDGLTSARLRGDWYRPLKSFRIGHPLVSWRGHRR